MSTACIPIGCFFFPCYHLIHVSQKSPQSRNLHYHLPGRGIKESCASLENVLSGLEMMTHLSVPHNEKSGGKPFRVGCTNKYLDPFSLCSPSSCRLSRMKKKWRAKEWGPHPPSASFVLPKPQLSRKPHPADLPTLVSLIKTIAWPPRTGKESEGGGALEVITCELNVNLSWPTWHSSVMEITLNLVWIHQIHMLKISKFWFMIPN